MSRDFRKIEVLVTAGPTVVFIDRVRVITNIFTGQTGVFIAERLMQVGFKVRLLLSEYARLKKFREYLDIVKFSTPEELGSLIERELSRKNKYRAVIHTAAVSDFQPLRTYQTKLTSKKGFTLRFKPVPKIVKKIKKMNRDIFLVSFKLEVDKKRRELIEAGIKSLIENNSDIVVANNLRDLTRGYKGYIITKEKKVEVVKSRKELAGYLIKKILEEDHEKKQEKTRADNTGSFGKCCCL